MGLLDKFRRNKKQRTIVVGLDGMPYSFLMREIARGTMPNLARELERGSVRRMTSSIPHLVGGMVIVHDGKNPAKHNIFGFVDRNPDTMELFIPTAKNMRAPTIWETLSKAGNKVAVANVPVTFPPREVNGVLVGCFLSTDIDKAVYPASFAATLKTLDYRIDVDAWEAHSDLDSFIIKLHEVLDRRFKTLDYFYDKLEWDFLMLVVMETDRLYHFYWEHYDAGSGKRYEEFIRFHRKMDEYLGAFFRKLRDEDHLLILSDHGFCTLKNEFNLNVYLADQGLLKLRNDEKGMNAIDPASRAYSLIPGRVYVNLKGRERIGSVNPGEEYEKVRTEIIESLRRIKTPDTGEDFWAGIYRREEIYKGPYLAQAADIIALPKDGYEVKGSLKAGALWSKDKFIGCHTYSDALLYIRNQAIADGNINIMDLKPSILHLMLPDRGEAINSMDGRNILA